MYKSLCTAYKMLNFKTDVSARCWEIWKWKMGLGFLFLVPFHFHSFSTSLSKAWAFKVVKVSLSVFFSVFLQIAKTSYEMMAYVKWTQHILYLKTTHARSSMPYGAFYWMAYMNIEWLYRRKYIHMYELIPSTKHTFRISFENFFHVFTSHARNFK